ncbi:peroxisomal ATPase PEX6-like [Hyla sarda]|uniref:peroxisomal ATPase PEX6-like n=1 Tax=Hyla sarda TaxID=327740 RepID=UPI0024C23FC2|nr:peroxisomal ATPase PEX6-like [Hyla sarda]
MFYVTKVLLQDKNLPLLRSPPAWLPCTRRQAVTSLPCARAGCFLIPEVPGMADSRCLPLVRTRGPLTPRRLLLSSPPALDWGLPPSPRGPLPDTQPCEPNGNHQSSEKGKGAPGGHREERGPQAYQQGAPGGHREERGPQAYQQGAPGGHREERGPQAYQQGAPGGHREERGPQAYQQGAPGGHREERGPQAYQQGAPGGHREERGPQAYQQGAPGGHREERGPQAYQQGAPGGHREERGPQAYQQGAPGGHREERGPQAYQQGDSSHSSSISFGGAPDLCSPLVSSFARAPFPVRLHVAPLDAESLVRAGRLQEVGGPVDRCSALWVSRKQLRELGLYHREWVWVSLPRGNRGRHLAMIVAADLWLGHPHKYNHLLSSCCQEPREDSGIVAPGTAVISATLTFNLTSGDGCVTEVLVQRFSTEPTQEGRSALMEPPAAKLLYVNVVKSPAYSSESTFQQALCQHFKTPRVVQVGDVLCVSCLSNSEVQINKSQIPVSCPDLYFKVQKIEGAVVSEGYLASTGVTTLYQVGSVCSFVPSFPSRDGHVFWSSLFPAGLSHAVDEICRILLPHLQNTSNVLGVGGRILLTGPKGSGKVTAVRAACSRLNVHLYQVECARLCRDGSASSISRLRSVFSGAHECRPCVLLLCHLDLIGRERDGAGEDARVIAAMCSLLLGPRNSDWDWPLLVVSTTSRAPAVPLDLQSCFLHEVSLSAPSEEQRLSLLTALTAPIPLSREIQLAHLARRTAGFVVGDLCALLSRAGHISCTRILRSCSPSEEDEEGLLAAGFLVTAEDLDCALAELQEAHSEAIGAPKNVYCGRVVWNKHHRLPVPQMTPHFGCSYNWVKFEQS